MRLYKETALHALWLLDVRRNFYSLAVRFLLKVIMRFERQNIKIQKTCIIKIVHTIPLLSCSPTVNNYQDLRKGNLPRLEFSKNYMYNIYRLIFYLLYIY